MWSNFTKLFDTFVTIFPLESILTCDFLLEIHISLLKLTLYQLFKSLIVCITGIIFDILVIIIIITFSWLCAYYYHYFFYDVAIIKGVSQWIWHHIRTSMSDVLSSVRLYIIQFSKRKNSLLYDKLNKIVIMDGLWLCPKNRLSGCNCIPI